MHAAASRVYVARVPGYFSEADVQYGFPFGSIMSGSRVAGSSGSGAATPGGGSRGPRKPHADSENVSSTRTKSLRSSMSPIPNDISFDAVVVPQTGCTGKVASCVSLILSGRDGLDFDPVSRITGIRLVWKCNNLLTQIGFTGF